MKAEDRAELGRLVAWAMRTAGAYAGAKGLDPADVEHAALLAVEEGWRTYRPGELTRAAHVRRRVRFELWDEAKSAGHRKSREVVIDAAEGGDEEATPWEASVADAILASPEEMLLGREQQAAVDDAVARLPPVTRTVHKLRFREERPWKEVAATTQMPERTARWHGQQIRERLREALHGWNEAG